MSTHTLAVDGATLTYDVHDPSGEGTDGGARPLMMIASPMDASGFTTLRAHFTDRRVVTYDPRNTGRSERDDPTAGVSAGQHATDLHALLSALGLGPVDVFASSGGAITALTLVADHPDEVATLVAHEPPYGSLLPDAAVIESLCGDMLAAYDESGTGPAMARFIDLVMQRGPLSSGRPAPDPAAFGLPTTDDGDRRDPMMSNRRGGAVHSRPDVEALRRVPTRIVVGVGEETGGAEDGEMTGRASYALARELGLEVTVFPGGHAGFLGGEFGQTGKPVEFAARLREVLG